jgi:PIN domain nuclease of toxin-antitoxin system
MNLLLDSTYLFPFMGLEVRGVPRTSVLDLLSMGHKISVSEISLFELSAKGAKLVSHGALEPYKVTSAIRAIHMSPSIAKVPFIASSIQQTAFGLRAQITDYIDCIIMSSSIHEADTLVTEDARLHQIYEEGSQMFTEINPGFKVIRMSEALREAK